jgi:uncharacterized protein YyaL (SSP411 family)
MIAALARGAQVLGEPSLAEAAGRAARFLLGRLKQSDGTLLHRYRDGEAAIPGHLDDYAFLIWGLMELYEATFDTYYLAEALSTVHEMRARFEDPDKGGFFFTAVDGEKLIVRKKETQDTAVPSGNSVASLCLLRLGRLTGITELEDAALKTIKAVSGAVDRVPSAFTFLLNAVDFSIGPTYEVVVVGVPGREDMEDIIRAVRRGYAPGKVVVVKPISKNQKKIEELASYVKEHEMVEGKAAAYICQNRACHTPMTDPVEIQNILENG